MPSRSHKQCAVVDCYKLTKETYCDKHKTERHKEYKRYRQDKKEQAFYNSKEWQQVRDYKRMVSPLCELCLELDGIGTPVQIVHHKVEVKDGEQGWSKRLLLSNLQSVCYAHHNMIHAKERNK